MFNTTPTCPDRTNTETLVVVQELLDTSTSHISFPPDIERVYQQDVRNHHRRRTLATAVVALGIFYGIIVLGLSDSGLTHYGRIACSALAGFLPVLAAMIWLHFRPMSGGRQQITATAVLAFTLSANFMIHDAGLDTVRFVTFAFCLIVITANVVLSVDFRMAVFTTTACCMITSAFVLLEASVERNYHLLPILLMAATALLTLAANYRIETTSRYVYLLLLREKLQSQNIQAQNEHLSAMSHSDPLTGIANRRAFDAALERTWASSAKGGQPLALLMLDIDHFKRFNDTYGHPAGDAALRKVALAVMEATREDSDMSARLGGEEFAVIVRDGDIRTARAVARRIHESVAALAIPHSASPTGSILSVSIGAAEAMPIEGGNPEELIRKADQSLYDAKSTGRNRTGSDPRKAA